jgi:hypothetical protein
VYLAKELTKLLQAAGLSPVPGQHGEPAPGAEKVCAELSLYDDGTAGGDEDGASPGGGAEREGCEDPAGGGAPPGGTADDVDLQPSFAPGDEVLSVDLRSQQGFGMDIVQVRQPLTTVRPATAPSLSAEGPVRTQQGVICLHGST